MYSHNLKIFILNISLGLQSAVWGWTSGVVQRLKSGFIVSVVPQRVCCSEPQCTVNVGYCNWSLFVLVDCWLWLSVLVMSSVKGDAHPRCLSLLTGFWLTDTLVWWCTVSAVCMNKFLFLHRFVWNKFEFDRNVSRLSGTLKSSRTRGPVPKHNARMWYAFLLLVSHSFVDGQLYCTNTQRMGGRLQACNKDVNNYEEGNAFSTVVSVLFISTVLLICLRGKLKHSSDSYVSLELNLQAFSSCM